MKFSVTVQFDHLETVFPRGVEVNEESEVGRLARAVFTMLGEYSYAPSEEASRRGEIGEPGAATLALLLTNMAASDKLTELRILHSILVTYIDYLGRVRLENYRDVAARSDNWFIEVELQEHERIDVDVDVDGKNIHRRVRTIDLLERPNRDGDIVARETMANAPKRRMRLNRE
jgi:hypothetical protein